MVARSSVQEGICFCVDEHPVNISNKINTFIPKCYHGFCWTMV